MTPFPIPEILRTPLESLVLQAKIHSPSCKVLQKLKIYVCGLRGCVFFFFLYASVFLIYQVTAMLCACVAFKAVEFLSQVLDSPELDAVEDAVQNLQDIGE